MNYDSYKKFLEAKDKVIGEIVRDMCAVGVPPMAKSEAWRKVTDLILEAVEAGIAASKVERKEIPLQQHDIPAEWDEAIYHEVVTNWRIAGENIAIVEAEKQSKSWLEK